MIRSIVCSSIASRQPGAVTRADFVERLQVESAVAHRVDLFALDLRAFGDADEPYGAFDQAIAVRLTEAALWLDARATTLLALAELEITLLLDLVVGQLDLSLPPELLGACGRAGVAIQLITND
jgi:hypothetical protein